MKQHLVCLGLTLTASIFSAQISRADDDFLSLLGGEDAKKEVAAPKKQRRKKSKRVKCES